ncbi:hypothetical protein, partial [Peterkaempfera griseoplana]|uniref:hypothetical protein n=1 Tax=Peterkaempfera griseoplana TaxID=66896 RepID=UPI0014706997
VGFDDLPPYQGPIRLDVMRNRVLLEGEQTAALAALRKLAEQAQHRAATWIWQRRSGGSSPSPWRSEPARAAPPSRLPA